MERLVLCTVPGTVLFFMTIYGNPRLSTAKLDLRITVSLDRTCMQTREKVEKAG